MAVIVETLFDGGADKALDLTAGEISRKMAIGSAWSKLLIAVVCNVDGSTSMNFSGIGFRIGLTTNNAKISDGAVPHWYGWKTPYSFSTVGSDYIGISSGTSFYKTISHFKNGAESTRTGSSSVESMERTTSIYRGLRAVYLERSGSYINMDAMYDLSGGVSKDALGTGDLSSGFMSMDPAAFASLCGLYRISVTGNSPVDEAIYGNLDSVSLLWPLGSHTLRIHHLAVARWA